MKAENYTEQSKLWQSYCDVYFRWQSKKVSVPPQFAIITACNPKSQSQNIQTNFLANEKLCNLVQQEHVLIGCIDGGDKDFHHVEPGFAVKCNKLSAGNLALLFEQNAFYWVENNNLYLEPALLSDYSSQCLGDFTDHLVADKS